jgi:Methyltransferase domain
MIRTPDSLLLKRLFLEHGFEPKIASKQYATHHRVQDWQFSFLFDRGLKPHHNFLDIGCGWLRLAQALLPYLEDGRYFGIDAVPAHFDIGRRFLDQTGVTEKPTLLFNSDFAFETFGVQFDFAISHAVFTHLTHDQIRLCLTQLKKVMRPNGRCYCTFYRARMDRDRTTSYAVAGADPLEFGSAHISVGFFSALFHELDLSWEYLGRCKHPTGQHVIEIQFDTRANGSVPKLSLLARRTLRRARRLVEALISE